MANFCQFCGAQLVGDARFCTSCGRTVEDGSAAAAPPPRPVASQPPPPPGPPASQPSQPWAAGPAAAPWAPGAAVARGGSRLPLVVGAVVVVVVAAIVLSLAATSGPADAVTGHLAALAKGDDAAAYSFTATGFRSETSLAQFTAFVNANPIFRSATSAVTSRTVSGDTGTVEVDLTPPAGAKRSAEFLLVKEGGDWKIVGYKLRAASDAPSTAPAATQAVAAAPAATQAVAAPTAARTNVPAAAAPAAATTKVCAIDATPAASGVELIKNGTFDAGTSGWVEAKYFAPNPDTAREIAATTGVITFSTLVRGSSRAGLVQTLNVDVSGFSKVELTAVLQVDGATLGGTGQQGREAAIAFGAVYYDDACVLHNALPETPAATVNRMFWGGLYLKDPGAGETAAFGEKVAAGQWTRVTIDLTQLKAKVIVLVGVEGSGWGPRSGSADMISLKVTR